VTIRAAVIATHNRPHELQRCVDSIRDQVDHIIVIDNASDPVVAVRDVHIVHDDEQPPNLSRLWNRGLKYARYYADNETTWDVAILNDDAIVWDGWFSHVSTHMRASTADVACVSQYYPVPTLLGWNVPFAISTRVTGWAFMLRGEAGLRFDEQFRWWCGDDDISAQARASGGLMMIPGPVVANTLADTTTTGVLAEQSARDMQAFVDKWGRRPW
jgi:glycosyltransferase involved in cell wall biosynthesis